MTNPAHDLLLLMTGLTQLKNRDRAISVFTEALSGLHDDIRAVFVSGYSEAQFHTNFVLDEGLNFVQKPFTGSALLNAVCQVLDQSVS